MPDTTINWTRPLLEEFKKAYDEAVRAGKSQFKFNLPMSGAPHEFVTAYAKYLIEYLEMNLPRNGPHKTRI